MALPIAPPTISPTLIAISAPVPARAIHTAMAIEATRANADSTHGGSVPAPIL